MGRFFRHESNDAGFSLTELVVVVGLLPIVLAAAWGALSFVTKTNQVASIQGNAAHDFADPMEQMSSIIMQNNAIKSADPNRIEVWTDRNMDGAPELDAFYVTADKKLIFERWAYNSSRTTVLSHHLWEMSVTNFNVDSATPLFTYYDASGAPIPTSDIAAHAASDARRVRVRLMIDTGNGATKAYGDVRDILFRNRS